MNRAPRRALLFVCVMVLAANAFQTRYHTNPDGILYLDLAGCLARGDWQHGISDYWSPGYPALLAILVKCGISGIALLVTAHALSLLASILVLWSFSTMWSRVADQFTDSLSREAFFIVGVLGLTLQLFLTIYVLTPDMLATALLFWIAAEILGRRRPILIGLLFGIGYLLKTIFFPLALMTFATLAWKDRSKMAGGLIAFLFLSAPLVVLLSFRDGHLTIGEAGKINYQWVMAAKNLDGFLTPGALPPQERKLLPLLEGVSFSPSLYPGLLVQPAKWSFSRQMQVIALHAKFYAIRGLLFYVPMFLLLAAHARGARRRMADAFPIFVLGVGTISLYALTIVPRDPRYVIGAEFLFFAATALAFATAPGRQFDDKLAIGSAFVISVVPICVFLAMSHPLLETRERVARLVSLGQANQTVAVVGNGLAFPWLKFADDRIAAELPVDFCRLPQEQQKQELNGIPARIVLGPAGCLPQGQAIDNDLAIFSVQGEQNTKPDRERR